MDGKTFEITSLNNWKTTSLMNVFQKYDSEGHKLYDNVLLKDVIHLWKGNYCYSVSLYISKMYIDEPHVTDYMTFSQIKSNFFKKDVNENMRDKFALLNSIYKTLENLLADEDDESDEALFEVPVLFKAQNKLDREYGFGETSTYGFVGAKFSVFYVLNI